LIFNEIDANDIRKTYKFYLNCKLSGGVLGRKTGKRYLSGRIKEKGDDWIRLSHRLGQGGEGSYEDIILPLHSICYIVETYDRE